MTIPKFVVGYRLCSGRGVSIKRYIISAQASYAVGVLVHFNRAKTCSNFRQNNTHKLQESKMMGFIVFTSNSVSQVHESKNKGGKAG